MMLDVAIISELPGVTQAPFQQQLSLFSPGHPVSHPRHWDAPIPHETGGYLNR
jgi:hypothetical protein